MRLIYNGHEYRYDDDTGRLTNNYCTHVASVIRDDASDEYYYCMLVDRTNGPIAVHGEVIGTVHQNVIRNTPEARGLWCVQTYDNHN